jgi:SSS family solute:Na+ symporter
MPHLIATIMPPSFALIFLLLVFSASMSTLSSLVLVSSSAVVIDLLPPATRPRSLLLMRVFCAVFVALSLFLALSKISFIVNLMSISWGTVAGSFLAPYLYGLYWKGGNRWGALASMLSGLSVGLFGAVLFGFRSSVLPLLGSFAMLIPLGVFPVVSLVTGGGKDASVRL